MKKISELEKRFEMLADKVNDICSGGKGLPTRLLECVEITDFLLKHNKEDVVIEEDYPSTDRFYASNCYTVKYVYKGKLKTVFLTKFNAAVYRNWQVVENDDESAILSADLTLLPKRKYYKFDKHSGCIVEITELFPRKSCAEKAMNLADTLTMEILKAEKEELKAELEKLNQPKKSVAKKPAKNVEKDTEKPAKNVGKKTTKKKESK